MKWEHKCSLDWLRARQRYLTASDIKALLPITKTGRPRKVTDQDRLRILANKQVVLTEEDCWSSGAAARGHILEPFAVREFNEYAKYYYNEEYYWWDDKLVSCPDRCIAFSPDAMDVPMDDPDAADNVKQILEVKSYNPERFLLTASMDKADLEERWQIATAMALLPNISGATLELYNPSMRSGQIRWFRFSRLELVKEIEMILKVEEDWKDFCSYSDLALGVFKDSYTEETALSESQIIEAIEERQRLNPI